MPKKIFIILAITLILIVMLFILTGCGNTNENVNISESNSKINTKLDEKIKVSSSETEPYLPKGAKVVNSDLELGLTIKDSNDNEWVWIEVPKSLTKNAKNDEEIEQVLKEYTKDVSIIEEDYAYVDKNYTGTGLSDEEYNNKKSIMLQSIKANGGFYIGRYETGYEEETIGTVVGEITQKPVIKQNVYPYVLVTNSQAEKLAEQLSIEGKTTSLMFGLQWDLVLKYLNVKGGISQETITKNSSAVGNYANSEFTINRGQYYPYREDARWQNYNNSLNYYVDNNCKKLSDIGQGALSGKILLTTGASDAHMMQNIYDLAGNVYEWTIEKSYFTSDPYSSIDSGTARGGNAIGYGSKFPLANRCSYTDDVVTRFIGFRVTLY